MKKVLFALLLTVITMSASAQAGSQSVGLSLGYAFDTNNTTIGVDYRYNITDEWRLAPSVSRYIQHDYIDAWVIDANVHYVFRLSEMVGFYPLAGLSLSFWDIQYDSTRFGANLGLGSELYATENITIGLEAKYNIVSDFGQPNVALRIGYNF